ncbi:MAG: hypothetical protein M9913_09295 [Bryobacteraceae bacterium]|nr:hypothetical protein [Bryobacteraceae bacterium]
MKLHPSAACVTVTQPRPTFVLLLGLFALLAAPTPATPQASPPPDEDFIVYSDSPRLLLNSRRLRLMQRERERESMRWLQFEALMNGNAVMPEPGFARALFGIITARREPCKSAAAWAASDAANPNTPTHARQIALVYDWCLDSLDGADANALTRRLQTILSQRPASPAHVRSVVFAAIALADIEPKSSQDTLRWAANSWWRASILPALARGEFPFASRADLFAMVEFLHAFRDNLRIDLREGAEKWFEELPPRLLLNYYPLPWPAAENEFRIPAFDGNSEPDLREAALARAAELALVAFDTNAQAHQFLQGWLMMDRFLMRGPFGAPYELLWANPYQPGLSYTYMPELFHAHGQILARSHWDEDATWFSYRPGHAQAFQNGRRIAVNLKANLAPVTIGPVRILFAPDGLRFQSGWLPKPEPDDPRPPEEHAFIVGLQPGALYDIEIDDQEMEEAQADSGGIIALRFPAGEPSGVRLKLAQPLGK